MLNLFRTEETVLHYAPTADRFFEGYDGYQILAKVTYLFGWRVRIQELDREDVPHWHYVQQRTLGASEWRSRLLRSRQNEQSGPLADSASAVTLTNASGE